MKRLILFYIFINMILFQKISAQENIEAKINHEEINNFIKIENVAINNSELHKELEYLFISIRKNKQGNISSNKQSGKFSISPKSTKKLSETTINIDPSDELKCYLYLKDENSKALISKDSLMFKVKKKTLELDSSDPKIFLQNLTIDETKTRAGKDFYDNFYIKINQMNKKYNKTISIVELPTFARNTQIQIFVEDRLINQFIVNPSEEFLENQVNFTINILDELFANDQNFKKEFSY